MSKTEILHRVHPETAILTLEETTFLDGGIGWYASLTRPADGLVILSFTRQTLAEVREVIEREDYRITPFVIDDNSAWLESTLVGA